MQCASSDLPVAGAAAAACCTLPDASICVSDTGLGADRMVRVELKRLDCKADTVEIEVSFPNGSELSRLINVLFLVGEEEVVLGRGPLLQIDLTNVSRR